MYEDITFNTIINRMLERASNEFDKREGSPLFDAAAMSAMEHLLLYIELNYILDEAFADTASRDYLIRRAAERGVIPKAATKTILRADFTPASLDLMGARFNLNSLAYVIIEKIADGKYNLECEMPGSAGNQNTGNLIPIDYIPGLQTATISEIIVRGEDEEDTEDFRKRYVKSFDVQAFGGNQKDYIERTNQLTGGATKVTPGSPIILTILDSTFLPAAVQLINDVQMAIDPQQDGQGTGIAPIGHIVTVVPATPVSVQVQAKLFFDTDYAYENVQEQVIDVIEEYLLEIRKEWENQPEHVVRITQLESRLLSVSGIVDILNTKINGQLENLIVSKYSVPIMGGFMLET